MPLSAVWDKQSDLQLEMVLTCLDTWCGSSLSECWESYCFVYVIDVRSLSWLWHEPDTAHDKTAYCLSAVSVPCDWYEISIERCDARLLFVSFVCCIKLTVWDSWVCCVCVLVIDMRSQLTGGTPDFSLGPHARVSQSGIFTKNLLTMFAHLLAFQLAMCEMRLWRMLSLF